MWRLSTPSPPFGGGQDESSIATHVSHPGRAEREMGTPCAPHVSLHGGSVLLPDDGSLMWVMLMGWPGGGDGAAEAGFQNPELSRYQNAVVKELSSAGGLNWPPRL